MNKNINKALKLGLACCLIGVGITSSLTGCGNAPAGTTEVTTEAPTTEVTTEAAPEVKESAVGDTVTLGDWDITLDSFKVAGQIKSDDRIYKAREGKKLVIAKITVKNNGKEENEFLKKFVYSGKDIVSQVVYETEEFSGTDLLGYKKNLFGKKVKPSSTLSGVAAYEVPTKTAKSEGLKLVFSIGDEAVSYVLK